MQVSGNLLDSLIKSGCKVFKPVVDESDDFLCNVIDFPSGTVRGRNVSTILCRMQELANTVATQVLEEAEVN